jgi:heme-degrading monooxygenase HmoA
MIYNTQVFEVTDAEKAKEAWLTFRESLEAAGGSDIRVFKNVDKPNQVIATMWWESAEVCRKWGADNEEAVGKAVGELITGSQPEDLWEEV